MQRIGPKMLAAAGYVKAHPGCAIRPVAHAVSPLAGRLCGPEANESLGYNIVHRAVRAGLIVKKPGTRKGTYALYPVLT